MGTLQNIARYEQSPLTGLIKVSKIKNKTPIEYSMTLYHDIKGIVLSQEKYPTIQRAIAQASLHGFKTHQWNVETKNA